MNDIAISGIPKVEISDDKMSAYLIFEESETGEDVISLETVQKEIDISEINLETGQVEIEMPAIENALKNPAYGDRIIIARGIRPINGVDGIIEYRFETGGALTPKKNDKDEMDYKDLGLVKNIFTGTVIADITPETEGEDGIDVCGNAIKALPGKPPKYMVGQGTELDEEGLLITTTTDGNLAWHKDHFTVEEVMTIGEDVGPATGNVDFIGDVIIKGNVFEGFAVKSKKNILINGTVNNATIEADGNIEVKMGCVHSTLSAKGEIKIGFGEGCTLESGGDMISSNFISCDIVCKGSITAITGKGVAIGGKITAYKGMVFNSLGSAGYTKTNVTLGEAAILAKEKKELEIEEAGLNEKINQHVELANTLQAAKKMAGSLPKEREEMLSAAVRGRFQALNELKKIKKRIVIIDESFTDNTSLYVEVRKTVFPGVSVRIGEQRKKVESEWDRCRIAIDNTGEIEITPIATRPGG
ncbi:MAG: FapA family protein [Oscillospiraceae bacterium]|nr:FapA family protein [Oscillospiraceae bacterium]